MILTNYHKRSDKISNTSGVTMEVYKYHRGRPMFHKLIRPGFGVPTDVLMKELKRYELDVCFGMNKSEWIRKEELNHVQSLHHTTLDTLASGCGMVGCDTFVGEIFFQDNVYMDIFEKDNEFYVLCYVAMCDDEGMEAYVTDTIILDISLGCVEDIYDWLFNFIITKFNDFMSLYDPTGSGDGVIYTKEEVYDMKRDDLFY